MGAYDVIIIGSGAGGARSSATSLRRESASLLLERG